jgi:hypothetical protein
MSARGEGPARISEDTLFRGRIQLRQPAVGYRVNVDALLLAVSCSISAPELVV